MFQFCADQYECLEIFAKTQKGEKGSVSVRKLPDGEFLTQPAEKYHAAWLKFDLRQGACYEVKLENAEPVYCYLSGNENILEEGVRFLEFQEQGVTAYTKENLKSFFDTPYREQYHFQAYKNWLNDPNGLCWFQGYYHMFYQMNPAFQGWDNMHWGHAASKDLVHWTYLPVVLAPQPELDDYPEFLGGAFSGSALVEEDQVSLFFTRHFSPTHERTKIEYQSRVTSKDLLHFSPEEIVLRTKPSCEISQNFRDPKVFIEDGIYKMVVGSGISESAAMLQFHSRDQKKWVYDGPVVQENDPKIGGCFECPDLFQLDGKMVAVGCAWKLVLPDGRKQTEWYYIGERKDGCQLAVESKRIYDFGTNFYAIQSFEHQGRRIAVGWVADNYKEHVEAENGAYGSMGLPRELRVKEDRLIQKPVEEIYSLLGETVLRESGKQQVCCEVPGNSYWAKVSLSKPGDFSISLGEEDGRSIRLECVNGVTGLRTQGVKSENIGFVSDVEKVTEIEIFVDRRLVEVYLNGGEGAGAKLFYQHTKDGRFAAQFEENILQDVQVRQMNSAW